MLFTSEVNIFCICETAFLHSKKHISQILNSLFIYLLIYSLICPFVYLHTCAFLLGQLFLFGYCGLGWNTVEFSPLKECCGVCYRKDNGVKAALFRLEL